MNNKDKQKQQRHGKRNIVEMLSAAGEKSAELEASLMEPSAGSIARLEAIPLLFETQSDSAVTVGSIDFANSIEICGAARLAGTVNVPIGSEDSKIKEVNSTTAIKIA